MSLTLGEKLRQAREERGFTLSEVAEQTRISSLYLESIENNDYRILPGGIFNKGFVKSYAKFVGINEQEALSDYSELIAQTTNSDDLELKIYKPEVLTDDRSGSSMTPTIIFAVVILGLMTAGVLFLVNYLRQPAEPPVANLGTKTNTNTSTEAPAESTPTPSNAPDMATLKIEFKAISEPVSLTATNDGKMSSNIVTPGSTATFEPKETLKLSYSKSLASAVQLTINGKAITLPAQPLVPRRNTIEFEINKETLPQIWTRGAISTEVPAASPASNTAQISTDTPAAVATPAPEPRPTVSATRPTPERQPKISGNTNAAQPKPAPTRQVIVVGNANRPG